jgi:hypothetical protein
VIYQSLKERKSLMAHALEARRRLAIATLLSGLVLALVGLAAVAPSSMADESCSSGFVCAWSGSFYGGTKNPVICTGGFHTVGTEFSAKNRCANKAAELYWFEGEVIHFKVCMNPGGDRPEPGRFNRVNILAEGSRC